MDFLIDYFHGSFLVKHMALMCKYTLTATLIMGVLGNFVNILVFSKLFMRKESFGLLLLLSTVDLIILSIISAETLLENMFLIDIRSWSSFFCKIDTFSVYFLTQTRNVVSMGIIIERALIMSNLIEKNTTFKGVYPVAQQIILNLKSPVKHTLSTHADGKPFRQTSSPETTTTTEVNQVGKLQTCQNKRFHRIHRFLAAYVIVLFWANFQFSVFLDPECVAAKNTIYEELLITSWIWFDMFAFYAIPLLAMTVSFLIIFVRIRKLNANYSSFLGDEARKLNTRIYLKKIKRNKIVIIKLLLVNCYFFASILPYFLINITKKGHNAMQSYFLKSFVDILLYSNNALTFFFYGISSQVYRMELFKTFRVFRKKIKKC